MAHVTVSSLSSGFKVWSGPLLLKKAQSQLAVGLITMNLGAQNKESILRKTTYALPDSKLK